jgi:hypothetical protein
MSNDGFRVVPPWQLFYWSFTEAGEEHQSPRGYPTITEAADEADISVICSILSSAQLTSWASLH